MLNGKFVRHFTKMDFATSTSALVSLQKRKGLFEEDLSIISNLIEYVIYKKEQVDLELNVSELLNISRWDTLAVGMTLSIEYSKMLSEKLDDKIIRLIENHVEHKEPRLRTVIAKMLGALAGKYGTKVYRKFSGKLFSSIEENLTRRAEPVEEEMIHSPRSNASSTLSSFGLDASHALDDTSGWKALETSVVALKEIILGCGQSFVNEGHLTTHLVDIAVVQCTEHINRHVRVAGFDVCTALCLVMNKGKMDICISDRMRMALEGGLQDNWSQVRYAASVTTREFFMKVDRPQDFYTQLVPPMCLNRYYMAEGVKLYSQDTWKLLMKDTGRDVVRSVAKEVAAFYIKVSDYDNHVVREAACHCIAELTTKIDAEAVRSSVAPMLDALLVCFKDDSWPVRDAACVAAGQVVANFPHESKPSLNELLPLWIEHLSDNIWSVREDTAIALGFYMKAYGDEAIQKLKIVLDEYIVMGEKQRAMSQAEFEALKYSEKAHQGNQVYSCGSLAPKLRKGGCSDCRVHRPKKQWEYTDGAVYLIRELCVAAPQIAITYFARLAQAAEWNHFPEALTLQETIWKQLPKMCQILGKKEFKRHLELFLNPLTRTAKSHHRLASFAAQECARLLSMQIGPTIFLGRLEADSEWKDTLSPFVAHH